ncbi:monosaccharide ABC transporter membrane protein, CUT2 family [Streptomyces sp. TverLS-915]|uniref:ABC transporter permease n=1 Tax=Streptomyces sp. TverLS-915 TaxID=1839763 RepID=UPI00081DCA26|nr:ABC transporter permease [Streptomyces sp. TverLS-915]SCD50952.1 monosaccharide ABC transporter membrane protein, CUT2 family [Streptomyces sp. TverLS-915]
MSASTAPVPATTSAPGRKLLDRVLKARELAVAAVLVVMLLATQLTNTGFLSQQGVKDLLLNATILVLVATGQAVVVLTRNVDLSVGSVLGISAFAAGDYLHGGGSPWVAVLYAVAVGAVFGLLNGALVSLGKVPALVVTLGTLYIVRGIDSVWVGSRQIVAADLPDGFVDFGHDGVWAVPYLAVLALAVLLAVGYYLRHYRGGRELYALGSSPEAATLAGIAVRKRVLTAYVLCGVLAGLAGALYLARFGNVDSATGNGYELTVVSAVVVGGVAFTGGAGTVYGAALGALLLTSINSVLPAIGVSSVWVTAINGVLLLLAIAVDRVLALRVAAVLRMQAGRKRSARHA